MSSTLLRLGLWTLILALAFLVLQTSYPEEHWISFVPPGMLTQAVVVSALLIVAGLVLRILGKGAKVVQKNRCAVCRTAIPPGAIYCREHLRTILHEEDDRRHTLNVRRP